MRGQTGAACVRLSCIASCFTLTPHIKDRLAPPPLSLYCNCRQSHGPGSRTFVVVRRNRPQQRRGRSSKSVFCTSDPWWRPVVHAGLLAVTTFGYWAVSKVIAVAISHVTGVFSKTLRCACVAHVLRHLCSRGGIRAPLLWEYQVIVRSTKMLCSPRSFSPPSVVKEGFEHFLGMATATQAARMSDLLPLVTTLLAPCLSWWASLPSR
ncbi:hypothetical protein MSAN_01304000 [Mycena sanguinolenta]|uniref:Uncharacterized protein n=1 Tax=Mycena sanguinolenta TaxID=230812 RepID=A0A8H7D069_9AGAR|nr:hypothetical protein MSAN_01304000 [Mycena sanguinolenta]